MSLGLIEMRQWETTPQNSVTFEWCQRYADTRGLQSTEAITWSCLKKEREKEMRKNGEEDPSSRQGLSSLSPVCLDLTRLIWLTHPPWLRNGMITKLCFITRCSAEDYFAPKTFPKIITKDYCQRLLPKIITKDYCQRLLPKIITKACLEKNHIFNFFKFSWNIGNSEVWMFSLPVRHG